jgi:hypothetical protein
MLLRLGFLCQLNVLLFYALPYSGEVGAAMGRKNGQYAVQNYLKPIAQAAAR